MKFNDEVSQRVQKNGTNERLKDDAEAFMMSSIQSKYSYNYSWMGRPIIQYPQDMIAMQEIIWQVQPDLIIETGIAHGGSLIFYASLLELLAVVNGVDGRVLGIDIDIREHNLAAIQSHPMSKRVDLIQGSSIDQKIIDKVKHAALGKERVLVVLDSNHTHDHVLAELYAYAPLVTVGSYCVVFDTIVEDLPKEYFLDRPWEPSDNPKTAVWKYMESKPGFEIDKSIQDKLLITVAPDGYLKRIA